MSDMLAPERKHITKHQYKKRMRRLAALRQANRRIDRVEAEHLLKNSRCNGRTVPSLAPITMRVVDWDVR